MTKSKEVFSKHFLWGAAVSAHQVEGGLHNQLTVWEYEHARVLAAQAQYQVGHYGSWEKIQAQAQRPENYVSDRATNHYDLYKQDFDLLGKMHMNAFRFSVEWSRIEPTEGVWNPEAIAHYKEYVKELRRRDIEPIMTLFHFSLPTWFAEKGGFEKRSNVKYFTRFVEKIVSEIGSDVKYIITVNEPEVYALMGYKLAMLPPMKQSIPKMWKVVHNLIYAHKKSAQAIHRISSRFKVSIAKNSVYIYPGDDALLSRLSANVMQYFADDYVLARVARHCDFLGLNYYQSFRVYGYRIHNPETPLSDTDWVMAPADIEFVLERHFKRFKLPIIITENGVADAGDEYRKWWIAETLRAVQSAMKRGVDVRGYIHWTLTDSFEWMYGRWPRFGLAAIDYKTGKRTLRPSAQWFGRAIKKLRGV